MRRAALLVLMFMIGALQAEAKSFIYSYSGASKEDAAVHTCIGTLADGKVTSKEAFVTDDMKMRRAMIGSSGDIVVFARQGGIADCLDLKTMKLTQIADDFLRAVYVSPTEMVYLARVSAEDAPRNAAVLKKCIFSSGTRSTICDRITLEQWPQQFAHNISQPLDIYWGVFLIDKKKVIGNVELSNGKFSNVTEVPADALSNDISPDGKQVLLGISDFDSAQGTAKGASMAVKLVLIDAATGESKTLARSIHQQVPGEGNTKPRFTALFTDNSHIVYPETVIQGNGEISFQRLVSMDLSTRKTKDAGIIEDANRLVNAVPIRTRAGDITWGEFKLDVTTLKTEKFDAAAVRGYSVSTSNELVSNDKIIGHLVRGMPVWGGEKMAAFVGSPEKDGKPSLCLYEVGSEKALRITSEDTSVVGFMFLE